MNHIDILLVSETHFTTRSFLKIKNYDLIRSDHPSSRAHAGAAIIIKSSINYEEEESISLPHMQVARVKAFLNNSKVQIASVYSPPRHNLKCEDYKDIFNRFGDKFIVAGDFNAKHPWWGSRLATPKGNELYKCIVDNNYHTLSTGTPTYHPTDPRKVPDLLDFVVYSGIPSNRLEIKDSGELSSDHSALILSYSTILRTVAPKYRVLRSTTDINSFNNWIEKSINLKTALKTGSDIDEAIEYFTNTVHEAAYLSTPCVADTANFRSQLEVSAEIRQLILAKRRLRRRWQYSRSPADKTILNKATKELKQKLAEFKNEAVNAYLKDLSASKNRAYNLWNATKYLKRPVLRKVPFKDSNDRWCRSDEDKAIAFADYLKNTFSPISLNSRFEEEETNNFLNAPCQMDLPIKPTSPAELREEINQLNSKKSPGYDQIDAKTLKALRKKSIVFVTQIFNAIIRLNHFPTQWKCAEIIMICKPAKPEHMVSSYRPISLLSILSKLFERILLRRLLPALEKSRCIPDTQFGFRRKHGTIEQCHRVINEIRNSLENKKYCSAAFLDVQQAFDRVWHSGLLYKIKKQLPAPFFLLLKSYLDGRKFYTKVGETYSDICNAFAGVPQGSVLSPVLYNIFTSDMPIADNVLFATYADDTAVLASSHCHVEASRFIQTQLDILGRWFNRWNIRINAQKSAHITFTLKRGDCPNITINGNCIPKGENVKYLGFYLDRRLTWATHIKKKRAELNIKTKRMYWLLGKNSKLSLENKVLIYKTVLKPVWTYGIQLWGTASNSNIEILQRYQSKTLRMITNAPWFVKNSNIHKDLQISTVKEEINRHSRSYLNRLSNHINVMAICLLDETVETNRLKRQHVLDLPFRP